MSNPTARRRNPSALAAAVALAACSFALPPLADGTTIEMQLTPAGAFKPSDGRPMPVPAWKIDQAIATRVIGRFQARRNPPVVDYEHQTLHKETNGQPAPAAGWMRALQWRESGLWATVELTARAAEMVRSGEYAFASPVFHYDPQTGEVLAIEMAALTNHAAIDGMDALSLRAAATFGSYAPDTEEEDLMNPLLAALLAALGLPETTTEDQAIAACSALKTQLASLGGIAKAVGVEAVGDGTAVLAACTSKLQAGGEPDPAKYVPVAALTAVQNELAALSSKINQGEVTALVEAGLADGRILPAMKDWATDLGKKDLAALSAYLDKAQPIAALAGSQTNGEPPAGGKDGNGLTGAELAICTAAGVDPKDYAAAKAA
ncbi:hypothetical protein CSC62_14070 [Pseudoxanthomonas jiangsuensis]|uniref:phage protease n=1 Tax=Pseudoxanthomonas jiangsuensis TaxID=619688 RepID=UPI00139166E0|nr:phage protease [Pseudoxanthomonas jiangsuensis]KAF1692756.1 hypothetical protein CSC62_14070 [Pseudoxanthomonas jiangsuensis]